MALKTVRVPAGMEAPFETAEETVSRYFREMRMIPERGTIEIFGERYVLVRAASLSVEFFGLVRDLYGEGREGEAEAFARHVLFDLAHAIGKSDARNFHARMNLSSAVERLSAGPVHFAHAGWAFVDVHAESKLAPQPGTTFSLVYDHPYSFESDAWIRSGGRRDAPACIMNAGYSSGWCEESFGLTLVSTEILCRAKGDACCRFVMAHPDDIETEVERVAKGHGLPTPLPYEIPDFFSRKRAEEELRRTRDELEQRVRERTRELAASNDLLRREIEERAEVEKRLRQAHKLEAVGRLAGGVAHDFNNLMSVVIGRSALLQDRLAPDDPIRVEIEQIRKAGERAAALTEQLLAFSRAQVLRREVLDVNAVARDVAAMIGPVIGDDVEVELDLGEAIGSVLADRGQLEQVLVNLLVNAREAMPNGGRVRVTTRGEAVRGAPDLPDGRYVVLEVEDTGVGMDEATLARVFDPFFTTKPDGGTGLGLATVYGIVTQSGGAIGARSTPGQGTRFTVRLPCTAERVTKPASVPREGEAAQGRETVLLVEDRTDVRRAVRDFLEHYGYEVLAASGTDEALEMARAFTRTIHLLLTDVVMPRGSGPELAETLRTLRPGIRVVFMSGYAPDPAVRERLGALGGSFLQKPFPPEELAAAVRKALDGGG